MNRDQIAQLCNRYAERLRSGEELSAEQFLKDLRVENDAELYEALQLVGKAYLNTDFGSQEERGSLPSTEQILDAPSQAVGTFVGPYKLLQEIGQGGMGTVYMAEQSKPVTRRVALKIIKPGMDSRQVIARFEAERQALAMMEHPNIARVFDAGTTTQGRPFFVMELVKGVPITSYCDEHRLTPQERLQLFLPVCEAIQHAHQKGIIHRDIKPTNILVAQFDDRPVPKVIDFGLAKAVSQPLTDKTMFTQFGQILGTIDYMSPEQASFNQADVDTRTDIYSLGVVLYELLTGETPFDRKRLHKAAFDELIRIIRNEEPPRPSVRLSSSASLPDTASKRRTEPHKLSRLVRDELDWIVMKALEKDRSQRYETANGFSADIKRYLNDEQVVACPPSNWNRFKKFARRNKIAIGTAGAVCLALILGLVGTVAQAIRANKQRDRALIAEQLAESRLIQESKARVAAQQATNEAESARDEAKDAVFDLNTSFGLLADELGKPSEALLWFAEAAAIAKPGSSQERESRVRLRTWSRVVSTPIHAFEHKEVGLRAMHFDSSGKFLATLTFDDVLRVRNLSRDGDLVVSLDGITSMDWHPNRAELAVGNSEGKVEVLAEPSFLSRGKTEVGEPVSAICYSPDGEFLATGGRTVCIWNEIGDPAPERKFPHPDHVVSIQVSKKSDRLLTVCEDDLARVFDLGDDSTDPEIPPIVHRGTGFPGRPLVEPRFVLEGTAVVTKSGNILIWSDTDSGGQRKRIAMDGPNVTCLSVSPDEQTLLIAGADMGYEVWDCKLRERIGGQRNATFWASSFSPDGLEFMVTSGDGSHQRFNIQDGSLIGEQSRGQRGHHHVEYSPSGRHYATCDGKGRLFVWLLRSLSPFRRSGLTWDDPQPTLDVWAEPRARHARLLGKGTDLALSRSGKSLLICGSNGIFGTLADAQILSTPDLKADGPSFPANSLLLDACLSPDETIVVTAGLRNELVFWDAHDGKRIGSPVQVAAEPIVVRFSDDGSRLMCLQLDGAAVVLDVKSRQIVERMQHGEGKLPDIRRQGNLNMYRQVNGFPMRMPNLPYRAGRFQPLFLQSIDNGRWVITGGVGNTICVWNGKNGSLRYPPIQLAYSPTAITISADEQLLATTDGVDVVVFELSSGMR